MNRDLSLFQLFGQNNKAQELPNLIDTYLASSTDLRISGIFVMSQYDLFSYIQHNGFGEYKVTKKAGSDEVLSFELVREIEKSNRKVKGRMLLVRTKQPNIYFTISDGDLEFLTLGMKRFFEELFPAVSVVRLSSKHLVDVLENLESKGKLKVIVDKTVANKRIYGHKKESAVTYTEMPFRDVFERASEEDRWIDKIDFSAVAERGDEKKIAMEGYISRSSLYRTSRNFSLFHAAAVSKIQDIAQRLFLLYLNRSRRSENKINPSRPLAIEFGCAIFDSPKKNKQLVDALKELTNSSISVIHANPYLHASLVDFLDGSSYDLWVLSQDRIIIVPQMRATYFSLNRICDHIFRKFREGNVKDFEVGVNDS